MFGQLASSHTVCSLLSRRIFFRRATSGVAGDLARIQSGLRCRSVVGSILTGMRAIFSAADILVPASIFGGRGRVASVMRTSNFDGSKGGDGSSRGSEGRRIVPQMPEQVRLQRLGHHGDIARAAKIDDLGDLHARVAAGVDALEGLEVHVHVEGEPVITAAAPHPQAERGDLGAVGGVHAWCVAARARLDAEILQGVDDGVFQRFHQRAHAKPAAAQVHHRIDHQLARTVIGYLAAAIDVDHRDVAGGEHVFRLAVEAHGEHRRMLQEPDLVRGVVVAFGGERLHLPPGGFIRNVRAQVAEQRQLRSIHRQNSTFLLAVSSRWSASSCAWLVARKVTGTDRNFSEPDSWLRTAALRMSTCRPKIASISGSNSMVLRPIPLMGYSQGNFSSFSSAIAYSKSISTESTMRRNSPPCSTASTGVSGARTSSRPSTLTRTTPSTSPGAPGATMALPGPTAAANSPYRPRGTAP